jgi:hypothetical protein
MDHIYAKKGISQAAVDSQHKKAASLRLKLMTHTRRAQRATILSPRLERRLADWERMGSDINSRRNKSPDGAFHRPGSNK